ncbi:uncharacterized protein LOC127254661 [Andrographis paniculata]|uniref:uncharacterized protein LOC127254661 n=1 Tax=Andrographis paniculata TaxID=175694 RepID=UPI0021E980F0|nr:uncharacterized protein LOC127254661 [Andrographis paniculata]
MDSQNDVDVAKQERISKQISNEKKDAAVNEELQRMRRLPPNSSYASHRLRVLHKIAHLLSLERTSSQDEELELLFAGLHI